MRFVLLLVIAIVGGCAAAGGSHARRPTGPAPGHGRITGVVRDAATGAPLTFARVLIQTGGKAAADELTDAAGRFSADLLPGGYGIEATFGKAIAHVPDVVVLEKRTLDLSFELETSPKRSTPSAGAATATADATGTIQGVVYDANSGERFVGAVIAVTAPSLTDAVMAMADEHGAYHVFGLPPDHYQLSVYYHLVDRGNLELRRGDIVVQGGQTTTVDLAIDLRVQR